MKQMTTTLLLIRQGNKILLAEKKRGFGIGKLNGVGGKLEPNESVEQAMIRETYEEINVIPTKYEQVAKVVFDEVVKGEKTIVTMYIFVATEYKGQPKESEEMCPHWFDIDSIPYDRMFPDDKYWLPKVLEGKKLEAYFDFDDKFNLLSHTITII